MRNPCLATALAAALLTGCTMVATPPPSDPGPAPASQPAAEAEPGRGSTSVPVPPGGQRVERDVRRGPTLTSTFGEVRGLWVVRSTMTSPEEVHTMVETAAANGFNTILVQVRGRADAFYRSEIEPRGETLPSGQDFDPLALAVAEAHARGIAVHAWVNTHLVWGIAALPKSPDHLVNANPEWLGVPKALGRRLVGMDPRDPRYVAALIQFARDNERTVEGVYSSPSDPAVQDRVYAVWMDLADRYDLDGVHFDYVRFPSGEFDYSSGALRRFRSWVAPGLSVDHLRRLTLASESDPYAFVEALPERWDEFRRAQITDLVRRVYRGVKLLHPDMLVTAAVIANQSDAFGSRYQDWPAWLAEGILDVAVPMAYTRDETAFRSLIRGARAAAGARERVWAGIGAHLDTTEGTLSKIDRAREEQAGGVILFSYDWAVSEGLRRGGGASLLTRVARERFSNR